MTLFQRTRAVLKTEPARDLSHSLRLHRVIVRADDFFLEVEETAGRDPWDPPDRTRFIQEFNHQMVSDLRRRPDPHWSDTEVAVALCQLAHEQLLAYGTDGGEKLNDDDIAIALRALVAVTKRLGVEFDPPYRNFTSFKSYWLRNNGYGSYQVRRELLAQLFDPLYLRLVQLEEGTFEALLSPVSPRASVGWPVVDEEIAELRRRFQTATTTQDYKDVGLRCVTVTEVLAETVYDSSRHDPPGEEAASRGDTKKRFDRYIASVLVGSEAAETRALARAIIVFAQRVKHATPTRRDAGIAADSVIILANLLRRLEQQI